MTNEQMEYWKVTAVWTDGNSTEYDFHTEAEAKAFYFGERNNPYIESIKLTAEEL